MSQWNNEAFEQTSINVLINCFEFATYELNRNDFVLTFLHKKLIHIEAKTRTTKLCKYIKKRLARNTYKIVIKKIFVKELCFKLEKICTLKDV